MSGSGGAEEVRGAHGANQAVTNDAGQWRIACINWSHPVAPKAVAYYINGAEFFDRYFKTWAEAVAWTDEITRRKR